MQTRSLGRALYFIIFVDDRSRYTWVYFISRKIDVSEYFEYFKEFKNMVEKQIGKYIKFLNLIRGENTNKENLINIVKVMGFYNNLQCLIHLRKMELLRGKIEH